MQQSNRELWLSFIAIVALSLIYLFVVIMFGSIPAASEFFGHSIGIAGFLLMLMTETLYSWRKRSRSARWGRMASWLQFHIFTGLVGPYMVLLHSSWKFNGLAGMVMLLTIIIVASGFLGRYIYTAVPRSADGIEIEASELERQVQAADGELQRWLEGRPAAIRALSQRLSAAAAGSTAGSGLILGRAFQEWGLRLRWRSALRGLDPQARQQARELERLLRRQRQLHRSLASLALARRLLGFWHTIHIPVGMALFTAAFIHVVAAIYYATLLR
jgi:hypothetical protein